MSEWIVEAECKADLVDGYGLIGEELIRCGECKWSYKDENTLICGYRGFFVDESFYCADRERKGNETTT